MIIRQYKKEDERKYLECRVLAYLDSSYYNDVKTKKEKYEKESVCFVAEENNRIVGFIDVELDSNYSTYKDCGKTAIIWDLGVIKEYRNKGIAKKLWNCVKEYTLSKNINYFELWTEEDIPANNFYKSIGFKQDDKSTWLRCYTKDENQEFIDYNKLKECYGIETFIFEMPYNKKTELKDKCYKIDEVRLFRLKL